jgi:hypothetical protein
MQSRNFINRATYARIGLLRHKKWNIKLCCFNIKLFSFKTKFFLIKVKFCRIKIKFCHIKVFFPSTLKLYSFKAKLYPYNTNSWKRISVSLTQIDLLMTYCTMADYLTWLLIKHCIKAYLRVWQTFIKSVWIWASFCHSKKLGSSVQLYTPSIMGKKMCIITNSMHCLSLVYWIKIPLHVLGINSPSSGGKVYVCGR